MNVLSKLIGAFILILFSAASQAQNYYVCDTGDDANTGKSETRPFKTHTKAMSVFSQLYAGDSILYCRGGKFYADTYTRLSNFKCGPQNVCTIADYGSENEPKPIIYGVGQTPFNFQNGGDSKSDGGYILKNLDLIATEKTGSGIMLYNDVNDIIVDNVQIEGFNIGFYSAGANTAATGNRANDRVILKNSTIINNKKQGWLGGCNDCLIENNHFENNGTLAIFDHNIYIDSPNKDQSFYNQGITVRGNTLTKANMVDGKCSGVSLVVHGIIKDLVIDNNVIKEEVGKVTSDCWGIAVDPGNKLDESFIGLKITNNTLMNVGNTGIGCTSCVNVIISNNTIIDEANVLSSGISVPDRKTEDSVKSDNVVIENNKIILSHDLGYGIKLAGSNPFIVRHNDISTKGTEFKSFSTNEIQSNSRCFMLSDANANTDVSINSCGTHTSVSIIEETTQPDLDESQPVDVVESEVPNVPEENENPLPVDDTEVVVVVEPIDEPTSNDSSPGEALQTDETDSQIVEVEPVNEPVFTEQPEQEQIIDSDTQITDTGDLVTPPTKQNRSDNGNQNGLNISETGTDTNTTAGTKPRKAAGGSSGGSSSKSSDSSSTLSSSDEQESVTDGVAYFEIQPITNSSTSTEISDTSITESTTIQSSSPSITKMKDVIHAKQEDLSNIDPSQCRASANGKCLMK